MDKMTHAGVIEKFNSYPPDIRQKMMSLRQLILDTARETETVDTVEETLKWGEPSFLTKNGSTIRIDWKPSKAYQYAIYFTCKTRLIETFSELYKDTFKYEGNRAIVFNLDEEIPVKELQHCLSLALSYHRIKHLPMLGE